MPVTPVNIRMLKGMPPDFKDWLRQLQDFVFKATSGLIPFANIDFNDSNLTSLETRNHNDTQNKQGGVTDEFYHLSEFEHTELTDHHQTNLHFHDSDRDSDNFFGTEWTDLTDGGFTTLHQHTVATPNDDQWLCFAIGDETTAITTGTAKFTWHVPQACTVLSVFASLTTVSSSGIPTVDINEAGTTILSTKLTIDANEEQSGDAATPAVISDSALAYKAKITFDIDVAGTGAKGLKIYMRVRWL